MKIVITIAVVLGGIGADVVELCLALNASQGGCYRISNDSRPDIKVTCKRFKKKPRVAKVVKVADDTAYAKCPAPSDLRLSNLSRSSTICLRGLK